MARLSAPNSKGEKRGEPPRPGPLLDSLPIADNEIPPGIMDELPPTAGLHNALQVREVESFIEGMTDRELVQTALQIVSMPHSDRVALYIELELNRRGLEFESIQFVIERKERLKDSP